VIKTCRNRGRFPPTTPLKQSVVRTGVAAAAVEPHDAKSSVLYYYNIQRWKNARKSAPISRPGG